MSPNPLQAPWTVVVNLETPGEFLTMMVGPRKAVLAFTSRAAGQAVLDGLADAAGLGLEDLDGWTLKDTYLTAATRAGAELLILDYRPGAHDALAVPIDRALDALKPRP